MTVTAVIPNLNGARRLPAIIADLRAQTHPIDEIVVADDGSSDGSAEVAAELGARVVSLGRTRGFTAAVNAGIRASSTELVAVVNNDVSLAPDWLRRLHDAIAKDGAPFASGKLLRTAAPELLDGSFDAICRGGCAWRCGAGRPDGPLWSVPGPVLLPPFTAVLLRRAYFTDLGGLDEQFGSYLEDVEFGLRSASKGYTGLYVPEAVGRHEGSATLGHWSPVTVRLIARNQLLLLARHYPGPLLVRFGWPIAVSHLLWGLVALRHGAGLAWVRGKIDGLRMFSSCRRMGDERIADILGSSERQIRELQKESGWDLYWRIYFALT